MYTSPRWRVNVRMMLSLSNGAAVTAVASTRSMTTKTDSLLNLLLWLFRGIPLHFSWDDFWNCLTFYAHWNVSSFKFHIKVNFIVNSKLIINIMFLKNRLIDQSTAEVTWDSEKAHLRMQVARVKGDRSANWQAYKIKLISEHGPDIVGDLHTPRSMEPAASLFWTKPNLQNTIISTPSPSIR